MPPEIVDLRRVPHRLDTVADRITAAFWQPNDRSWIAEGLTRDVRSTDIWPCALVAVEEGETYAGHVLVIANDCPERSNLTPWLAALWVEESRRRRGIGAALVAAACAAAARAGEKDLHLVSRRGREPFYSRLGWRVLETEVGPARLTLMARALA